MDNNFIALLKAMPKLLAPGLGTAIARAILARILLPAPLELLEADLPQRRPPLTSIRKARAPPPALPPTWRR